MIKILFTDLYVDKNILYFDKDFKNTVFICNVMGILNIDLIILCLTLLIKMKIILVLSFISDFWLGILSLKNAKHLKNITEELMSVVWHPNRWWNF